MTILEKIIEDLSDMDEQELETISEFIQVFRIQKKPVHCDRENILDFIYQVRAKLPRRTSEDIDRQIREERESWDD
jgi:hypothetical protein